MIDVYGVEVLNGVIIVYELIWVIGMGKVVIVDDV